MEKTIQISIKINNKTNKIPHPNMVKIIKIMIPLTLIKNTKLNNTIPKN